MEVSKLAKSITKAKIRVMYDLARQKENVIGLTVGEPDFQTPQRIIDISNDYFNKGLTKYTPNSGLDVLKEAIAEKYASAIGPIDPYSEVMITVGAQESLLVSMETLLDPGDEIMFCTPHYPSYINQAYICHAVPVLIETKEENGWNPDPEEIRAKITDRTKVIVLTSPCNPTGGEIGRETLEQIACIAKEHDLVVFSDECYNRIRYSPEPYCSIASFPGMRERTLVLNSFSKSYAMPGWRLGYTIGPEWIIKEMPKTHDVMVSCVPAPFQYAGAYALRECDDEVERMLQIYRRRKDIVYQGINAIPGLSAIEPKGAFYLFFNIKESGMTSEDFAFKLLDKESLALVPGDGFGKAGEGYIRMTYAASDEDLVEALNRLDHFMKTIRG